MASSKYPLGLGRAAWSVKHQESMMAVGLGTRQAADEEARAEVEVRTHSLPGDSQSAGPIEPEVWDAKCRPGTQ